MGLKEFLVNAKAGLAELHTRPKIHIVIGNEACDLDSTVSALTYAYFLHQTKSRPDTLILPVLNLPRQHFRLRLETIYLLHKHHITEDALIFVDELDLRALTQDEVTALSVTLVDHHEFSKEEECLKNFVVEVLDHRPLGGVLPESWNAEVEKVGSCCTLIARKMLASEVFSLDPVVAELLLGTILMDTGNMSVSDNVGTPADLEMISQLKTYVSADAADTVYEGIRNAKADLSSLTVFEMLYKDLKIIRGTHITVAMSSLTTKLEDVMSLPEFVDDCAAFCSACPADVLIIMTLWKDAGDLSHRRIAVFSQNRIYREQITDVLLSSMSPNLELEPMTSFSHMDSVSAFFQNNIQVFRKGVIPLIRDFLAGENSTPDENLNAVDNLAQLYPDSQLESGDMADASEEEVRKHINLAKAFQSDQFRTSQDRYDLAAIGTDPVISASVSSDSEFSSSDKRKEEGLEDDDDNDNTDDNVDENKEVEYKSYAFNSAAITSEDFIVNSKSGAGDGAVVDALVEVKGAAGDGGFVDNLIDFGFEGRDDGGFTAEVSPSADVSNDFREQSGRDQEFVNNIHNAPVSLEPQPIDQVSFYDFDKVSDFREDTMGDLFSVSSDNIDADLRDMPSGFDNDFVNIGRDGPVSLEPQAFDQTSLSDFDVKVSDSRDDTIGDLFSVSSDNIDADFKDLAGGIDHEYMNNNLDASINYEPQAVDQVSLSDFDVKISDSRDDTMGDLFSVSSDNVDADSTMVDARDENNFDDAFLDNTPLNLLDPDNVDIPMDIPSIPTSGQGSKIPSYPETPPNSCMEPSNAIFNKETQLPSFNSSEMVKRIHEKKAALAGYVGKQKMGLFDDEGPLDEMLLGGENSSGGGGSLISPAVPENSFVDISSGFDFQSSGSQLPKLMNSDIMERVNEKRSQFEWSVESLDGSTSGVDIGPVSEEGADKSPLGTDAPQHITVSGGVEPQVPYTPQNSYVEDHFDSYARTNLPSLNNAEMVAKIKAKQSAMFGNHGSSRVSRSSHGSDDSGGCHSPDVADKSPRGTSLDSPQAPYTPQNSYRDNVGVFETRNHLPDLNEVAERLSTENPLKRQFGKRSTSNSGGGSRDEENVNLNIHQHSLRHYGRNSSSQSDSQNTMSDVESLMSVSTDVGTPSDNIVAGGLANQMRSEMAMLSRKDTNDSDVFAPNKTEDHVSSAKETAPPKVSSIDLTFDNTTSNNVVGAVANGIDTDASDGVRNDSAGTKELFSPFDSEKVQTIEDLALFQVAENIVAQSVAAAVEFSQREAQAGAGRKESRLRWNDDVELDNNDNQSDEEHSQKIFVEYEEDEDNDGSDIEDDTVGDVSESFPENDLDKMGSENGSMENVNSENVAEEMTGASFEDRGFDSDFNSLSVQEQSYSLLDQPEEEQAMSQQCADEAHMRQEEFKQLLGSDALDRSQEIDASSVQPASQNVTDLALNELAFELANELIQSVLDDFPFSEDLASIHAETGTKHIGQEATDAHKADMQNITSQETPLHYAWVPDTTEKDVSANNVLTSDDLSAVEEIRSGSSPGSSSVSSSSERKRLKDTDSSLVILEDEMLSSFPERKMSSEFPAAEEEEDIIESFPGRKFSKSEDYPTRRFSRDDNSSRRSSRLEDSDLEVKIGPEDIETGYLPNVDPFQGNLDIFETSFSKITDADREVVEGESFRKVSVEVIGSNEEEEEENRSSDHEDDDNSGESYSAADVEDGLIDDYSLIPEVREELISGDADIPEVREELVSEDADIPEVREELVSEDADIPEVREELVSEDADILEVREELVSEDEDILEVREELVSEDAYIPEVREELVSEDADILEVREELVSVDAYIPEVREELVSEDEDILEVREELVSEDADVPEVREELVSEDEDIPEVREELVSEDADILEVREELVSVDAYIPEVREELVSEDEDILEVREELVSEDAYIPEVREELVSEDEDIPEVREELVSEDADILEVRDELVTEDADIPEVRIELVSDDADIPEVRIELVSDDADIPEVREELVSEDADIPEVRIELVSDDADIPEVREELVSEDADILEVREELVSEDEDIPEVGEELVSEVADIPEVREELVSEDADVPEVREELVSEDADVPEVREELVSEDADIPEVREELVSEDAYIPEVREELFSENADISFELDSQASGDKTEVEMFADFSREFHELPTENSAKERAVDISNELENQDADDFDELIEAESWTERQVVDVSDEMKMQALGKHEVSFLEVGNAETCSELDEQIAESELETQAETPSVLEVQTALSGLEQFADTRNQFEVETSEAARGLEVHNAEASGDDDITKEEASMLEVIKVPKQKKKIRVSFSEDFDDEIGDFNISSSSRSSLKSPPPLPSSEDSQSPSPSPSLENINDVADEEDAVSPLSAAYSHLEPHQLELRKEVYHTSAGRISIGLGEEEDSSSVPFTSGFSPNVASFTDEIIMKARAQVGQMIESAKGTISEADHQLEVADASPHASSAAVLYSSDVSQPELSSRTLQSADDAAVLSEDGSNNAFSIVSSDFASFDPTNSDPSAVNSDLLNEVSVKFIADDHNLELTADDHNLELTEPSAITSVPLTFSPEEPFPAVLAVSTFEDAPFDSLTMHVRTLSSASAGSVQGAVYSEEWQDDEIIQDAADSELEASHDDATRKKIVPDSDFVEAAVADNDPEEAEDNENKKEEDEESDAGDLEWENDTPVKIPTRPGIQPTLAEEEPSPEAQRWKRVSVSGSDFNIDMEAVEPFKNVLSHGGYYDEGLSAIIVFYGCNLPSRTREDYAYIMNHLFHYVIHTLEELVADDYVIIYFHGSTPRRQMPSLAWLKRCYQSIDRKLKKNLKGLFLVHPTLWLRTIVMMTKPFISTKFSSKLRFVRTLEELNALVPLTNVSIPDPIVHYDIHHQHLPTPPASPSHAPSSH